MKFELVRKQLFMLLLFLVSLTMTVSFSGNSSSSPEELCRNFVLKNIDVILNSLKESQKPNYLINTGELIKQYHKARKSYKHIEFFIEYYSAFDAKYYINGPLVPKNELEYGNQVFEPMGFQVIEQILFETKKKDTSALRTQYDILIDKFTKLRTHYSTLIIERSNLTEAIRLELIRIMCLTLNGYDSTINKEISEECSYSLEGIQTLMSIYGIHNNEEVQHILDRSKKYLKVNTDSDKLDRLHFTVNYLQPLYNTVCSFFDRLNITYSQVNYAVDFNNHQVFDIASINKQHFSLYRDDTIHLKQQQELGWLLFFDPILSGNNKRACASCHKPELAFTDGNNKSIGFDSKTKISRNAPTLLNAAYQKLYFHDGRTLNLEEQARSVFNNVFEMNISGEEITKKLKQSPEYVHLFQAAFKGRIDTTLTFYAVMKCLAEYIKTLDSKNSRFDKYIKGDRSQLNKSEINGYNLFAGKALCGSCHFYPLFNGLVPPMFNDNEFEVVGTPADSLNRILDPDPGRENITHVGIHHAAFKTPGLRNLGLTAPYMHNGIYRTLDQVLDFYNKGGGAQLKHKVENQTLPFDSLGLNKTELNEIKQFLLSLSDTAGTQRRPKKLPAFKSDALNKRMIGGEY